MGYVGEDYVMPWGKYVGESIDDVPRSYLEWFLRVNIRSFVLLLKNNLQ